MSEPTYYCKVCGRSLVVRPDGRGFPPGIAKRKLVKLCKATGHEADPQYVAGVDPALAVIIPAHREKTQ